MALFLALLLLLIFGITVFGRAWMTVNVMHMATGEGARLAVITPPDVGAVEAKVLEASKAAGITPSSVTVTGPGVGDSRGRVTVSMTADFEVLPGLLQGESGGTIPLSASTTMKHESP